MARGKIKPFDVFVVVNVIVLGTTTLTTYWTAEWEFGIYGAVLLTAGALGWRWLRRFDYPVWLLVLVQIGIASHLAGGYVKYGPEGWLYWHHFLGIRYDKIVHFYNSFVAVLVFAHMTHEADLELRYFEPLIMVGFVTGLGAGIEIVEYFATIAVPNAGVGDYANNMEDLILNLLGALTAVPVAFAVRRRGRKAA